LAYTDKQPVFAADRHTIYFSSNRGGSFQIWKMGSDGSGQSLVSGPTGMDQEWPAISTDGTRLAYSSLDAQGIAQIHIFSFSTGVDSQITDGPGTKTHPTWSTT